jgi:hypothetical protein
VVALHPRARKRVCVVSLTIIALASAGFAQTFSSGEKGKVKGIIKSRSGYLVKVQDDKTGSMAVVEITAGTKILRDTHKVALHRHEELRRAEGTATIPGTFVGQVKVYE